MPEMPRRGRPRSTATDERIVAAALEILRRDGPGAVTMEAVAQGSGVAKTTLYRRHPHRDALLRDALARAIGTPGEPPGGDVRARIAWSLEQTWRRMSDVLGPGGLAAIVAGGDDELTGLVRDVLAPYDRALATLLQADVDGGLLRADLDADACVSLFVGAYLGELVRHGRVADDWAGRCLDLMWAAMTRSPG